MIYIYDMATFTSTLPDNLLKMLSEKAKALAVPKNQLIENALRLYLEHLEKAEYIKSYKQASQDQDLITLAEEGLADYLSQFEK
jgi:metal-responsive CopG/Arc/MetJ family transcriptional regulator